MKLNTQWFYGLSAVVVLVIVKDAHADFKADCLNKHNALRMLHQGTPSITYSDTIALSAQAVADDLAARDAFEHSNLPGLGENLYKGSKTGSAFTGDYCDDATQAWYNEISDYDYNNPGFSLATGHFTQVVWVGSLEVGCGEAKYQSDDGWYHTVVVCQYKEPGNSQGEFASNVLPLTPISSTVLCRDICNSIVVHGTNIPETSPLDITGRYDVTTQEIRSSSVYKKVFQNGDELFLYYFDILREPNKRNLRWVIDPVIHPRVATNYFENFQAYTDYSDLCPQKINDATALENWYLKTNTGYIESGNVKIDCFPVDGAWGVWSDFTECSATCQGGTKSRARDCNNPTPIGGAPCLGLDGTTRLLREVQIISCNNFECDPDVLENACSAVLVYGITDVAATYINGIYSRGSDINNSPSYLRDSGPPNLKLFYNNVSPDERWIIQDSDTNQIVAKTSAPDVLPNSIMGQSDWFIQTGVQTNDGFVKSDVNIGCEVDGGWGALSNYGTCSKSCGGGTKTATKECNNPIPFGGGQECLLPGGTSGTSFTETAECNTEACPVDGMWSGWSDYGECSEICGGGIKTRTRTCNNPPPSGNGLLCEGFDGVRKLTEDDTLECNTEECSVVPAGDPVVAVRGACTSDADCSHEPFKKTCRVQPNSAGIRVCGDPHIRQTIKNSDRPLCYDFVGQPGKTYLFIKDKDFEITSRFIDSNTIDDAGKLVEYISSVKIKKGPVAMTFDPNTINIALDGKPIEKTKWTMGKKELPGGIWMTIDKKKANVFLDDGNTTVNIIRKGASRGSPFLNFGLSEKVISTEANGILGDLRNKVVYTPGAYGKNGTIRWAGVSFPVHDDGTTCLKLDPFYELKFNILLQIFQVD
ncbi:unnamed protein product [Owenia fusiformis]|uniref:Uncharacterized protein n=1 Tax=Owenia fusiformis TaxID=6347 RepID=A0A8J1TZH7_OWEFU|nr:unnamed protein product [Owenia fusiformis]